MTIAIFVLLCIAQLADVYTTLRAIKAGAVEANPALVAMLGKKPKAAGLLALKIGVTAWIGYGLHQMEWQAPNAALMPAAILTAVLFAVSANNLSIARRRERK